MARTGRRNVDIAATAFAALALAALSAVFAAESVEFRRAVLEYAAQDLASRTSLAASTLGEHLSTGNMPKVFEAGASFAREGMRLTVLGGNGGVLYDSAPPSDGRGYITASSPSGGFVVRLGIPRDTVLAPFFRAVHGFVLAAFAGAAGVALFFLATYRNRVRMRELARVERFRREFIADVSHEIRTPLTGITGAADMLSELERDAPPPRGRLIAMLKAESARLNSLAQGILDLARLEREEDALERNSADVAEAVRTAVDELAGRAEQAGVSIAFSSAGDTRALCDAGLVSQAAANLVANALRHSGSPRVSVSVSRVRGSVEISVEDEGRGIPPEQAERVFERFHRVDSSRSSESGGAGLGLAIVRRIARAHGGDARLEHVVPHGCRFVVSIPADPG